MSQPNTFFQLMSFHIKYAAKNPSGHSVHFQHPSTRQAKCTQKLKGTRVLRRKNLSLASKEKERYASVGNHTFLSPLEIKKEYSAKRCFSRSKQVLSVSCFVKSASEIEILVHKFPCFRCIPDAHWSALSAGKRLLQVCCCQWKNITQTTLYFQFQRLLPLGLDSWHWNCGLVTKLSELSS